eukprot:sb/3475635/
MTILTQVVRKKNELQVELEESGGATSRPVLSSAARVRLSEMRLRREVAQLKQQTGYLEALTRDHEETIRELEEENGSLYEMLTEQKSLSPITMQSQQPRPQKKEEKENEKKWSVPKPDTNKIGR